MERYLKPVHWFQDWEKFDPDNYNVIADLDYTYQPEWHAIFTIQLGELVESGVFDWEKKELNWRSAAYDEAQYTRVNTYFIERFRYREISIVPPLEWMQALKRKLVFELMPKYKNLYAMADKLNAESILNNEDEYYKRRSINSDYPETLLSENADYISDGTDEEWERIQQGNPIDKMDNYYLKFKTIDERLLDELEVLFVCMYTSYVNGY